MCASTASEKSAKSTRNPGQGVGREKHGRDRSYAPGVIIPGVRALSVEYCVLGEITGFCETLQESQGQTANEQVGKMQHQVR